MSLQRYIATLGRILGDTCSTDFEGGVLDGEEALRRGVAAIRDIDAAGGKMMFVGNGGSAGIASHMAIDFLKNGNIRAIAFNDGALLTCLGNDLGYENVFARPVAMLGRPEDLLVAISSSGRSPNILKAVDAARTVGCRVLTLSGFDPDNPLRRLGDVNFYVPSREYGFVEISHTVLCHAMVDSICGCGGFTR